MTVQGSKSGKSGGKEKESKRSSKDDSGERPVNRLLAMEAKLRKAKHAAGGSMGVGGGAGELGLASVAPSEQSGSGS